MSTLPEKGLIVAIIDPKPGKGDGIVEAYKEFIKTLKPREPDCTDFVVYRQIDVQSGQKRFITVEKYILSQSGAKARSDDCSDSGRWKHFNSIEPIVHLMCSTRLWQTKTL